MAGIDPELLVRHWNRTMGDRFPLGPRLACQALSVDIDTDASAADEDGLIIVKRHGRCASISALAVTPSHQGKGLGSRLLANALQTLRDKSVNQVNIGADFLHLLPGVPVPGPTGFFARHGASFAATPVVDLRNDKLRSWSPPAAPSPAERASRWEDVLCFLRQEFPGRWSRTAEEERRRGTAPGGYLLLREQSGQVIGFVRIYGGEETPMIGPSLYWSPLLAPQHGGLGPIGVAAQYRGLGHGLGLLVAGVTMLKDQGIDDMVIDWTDLVGFYGKAGFVPWRTYRVGGISLANEYQGLGA